MGCDGWGDWSGLATLAEISEDEVAAALRLLLGLVQQLP
jgi:hypothetical protein